MIGHPARPRDAGESIAPWKSRCFLLEQLVQALETNRGLLQRRVRRAERAAARAKAELHALRHTVSACDLVATPALSQRGVHKACVRVQDSKAVRHSRPTIEHSPTSASSASVGGHATLSPRQIARCPAALLNPRLLQLVFSFLDPRALVQTAQVCRRWRDLVDDPALWNTLEQLYPPLTPQRTPKQIASMWHGTMNGATPVPAFQPLPPESALKRAKEELQRNKELRAHALHPNATVTSTGQLAAELEKEDWMGTGWSHLQYSRNLPVPHIGTLSP